MRRRSAARVLAGLGWLAALAGVDAQAQLHVAIERDGEQRLDEAASTAPPASADEAASGRAQEGAPTASDHLPPAAPTQTMPPMTAATMARVMTMDDTAAFGSFALDRFEQAFGAGRARTDWALQAWYGSDFDRLWLRSEGEAGGGRVARADVELSWNHAIAPFWNLQTGLRADDGIGAARQWAAFGVQGLAPWWVDVAATAYVGERGNVAVRIEVDRDLVLGQRLILQPRVELNAYRHADAAAGIAAGVSDAEVGLRLRYEISRRVAPYVGVERRHDVGNVSGAMNASAGSASGWVWVAGLRAWF